MFPSIILFPNDKILPPASDNPVEFPVIVFPAILTVLPAADEIPVVFPLTKQFDTLNAVPFTTIPEAFDDKTESLIEALTAAPKFSPTLPFCTRLEFAIERFIVAAPVKNELIP